LIFFYATMVAVFDSGEEEGERSGRNYLRRDG
jgi:hypothetical protein